ncbi:hypothetical protein CAPTEDRAFT_145783 [Capitella teleta]|uniref:Kringle domain-containing protein n=1 Tax=Capitella teleta TaxID=283909 RepID=X1Z4D4_CAPTE|nr:hypothetical protein CAPTEDRAFT_145783 [Capitella teleta]|eukprot:ELU00257.1 hypothetical protein CAPTEDRAFT_145783 [Capitella teleta]
MYYTVAAECKLGQRGVEYSGTLSSTLSGRTCQRWDKQKPHAHNFVAASHFPGGDLAHNHCRNPSNDPGGPWCLTTDPKTRQEYCRVLFCSSCDRE